MSRTARAVGALLAVTLFAISMTAMTSLAFGDGNDDGNGQGQGGGDKITICHATGSDTNPFVMITIDQSGWDNGHSGHPGDYIATDGNCEDEGPGQGEGDKVTICHATGSATNPYVMITISQSGWDNGHSKHAGDYVTTDGNCIDEEEPPGPPEPPGDGGGGGGVAGTTTTAGAVAGTTTTRTGNLPFTGLGTNVLAGLAGALIALGAATYRLRPARAGAGRRSRGK